MASNQQSEVIFEDQLKLGNELNSFFVNYAKRAKVDRANLAFVTKQLNAVSEIYEKFTRNHKIWNTMEMEKGDQSYFEDEYANNIKSIFETGIKKLPNDRKTIEDSIPKLHPWLTQSEINIHSAALEDNLADLEIKDNNLGQHQNADLGNTSTPSDIPEDKTKTGRKEKRSSKWSEMVEDEEKSEKTGYATEIDIFHATWKNNKNQRNRPHNFAVRKNSIDD
ncbi:hypothetical protein ACFFRR_005228 [Megaselia abdita]